MKTATLSLSIAASIAAAFAAAPALAQDHAPDRDAAVAANDADVVAGHSQSSMSLGYEPMMLEIGEGERLSFPRSYGQEACPETVVRRIFRTELEDDFVASLRCWAIPTGRSSEFVQTLDQAIAAAGWEFISGAGMGAHYEKGAKELDVLIFGFDQFGDEPGQTDVGYLFGVVDTAAAR